MSTIKTSDATAARLAELSAAATKGPWTDEGDGNVTETRGYSVAICEHPIGEANAALIAELRNAVDSLLADRETARRLEIQRDAYVIAGDHLSAELARLRERVALAKSKLAEVVCTEGCDRGVVLLSSDGPTHFEIYDSRKYEVYDHENFSPLGDALINLWEIINGKEEIQATAAPPQGL